jgi:dihydropteroate synthase
MAFQRPQIMGVVNVTPDSFSDGGKFTDAPLAIEHARQLFAEGATILDIGGESTRPGAERVAVAEEIDRVVPVVSGIRSSEWYLAAATAGNAPLISVDTMNHQTALAAVTAGAHIVNDVSGGLADPNLFAAVAPTGAKLIISHWRGHSTEMDKLNQYQDIANDVVAEISEQVAIAVAAGISRDRIIVDPGLGFAKDLSQNWELVARLDRLEQLDLPVLVGASRKRFLAGVLEAADPASVDNGRRDLATAVLTALLLQRKLWGVRVHNVQATLDAIKLVEALRVASE